MNSWKNLKAFSIYFTFHKRPYTLSKSNQPALLIWMIFRNVARGEWEVETREVGLSWCREMSVADKIVLFLNRVVTVRERVNALVVFARTDKVNGARRKYFFVLSSTWIMCVIARFSALRSRSSRRSVCVYRWRYGRAKTLDSAKLVQIVREKSAQVSLHSRLISLPNT